MGYILHADLDAFYASVEQKDNPQLQGKPVLVGGRPEQRGVVAACSYEARSFGIHSAMPMRTALRLCPNAVVVSPRFDRYREISAKVFSIFRSTSPLVEAVSLDEAFLDITGIIKASSAPIDVAKDIKRRVRSEIDLAISVGVASSKSVAKIASDSSKPDGLMVVEPERAREFLAPLPVRKLWGIGPKTEERLLAKNIRTLGELAAQPDGWLETEFGKRGPMMKSWSLGQDNRPVSFERPIKSVSAEVTFAQDMNDPDGLTDELFRLTNRVVQRLKRTGIMGRTVNLKLRLSDFTTLTRSVTLPAPVQEVTIVNHIAQEILKKELTTGRRFRLIGVGVSNFASTGQLPLFDQSCIFQL